MKHLTAAAALVLIAALFGGCRSIPENPPRAATFAAPPAEGVRLQRVTDSVRDRHGDELSGFMPLDSNLEAMRWRLALVDTAEKTLDAKYFIWNSDATGRLLFDRVIRAAGRGVKVRLLIDDLLLMGRDEGVATLDAHPNIEIRVYNPWHSRDGGWPARALEGVFRFDEVNHRMHNKLLVADNHLAVVGGRNIGDEYYGLKETYNFRDFDVLAAGPVVPVLSKAFDEFWNSDLAYPGQLIWDETLDAEDFDESYEQFKPILEQHRAELESFSMEPRDWSEDIDAMAARMAAGSAVVVRDVSEDEWSDGEQRLVHKLADLLQTAREEILVSSPYLISLDKDMSLTRELTERGVTFKILTNSMASIDNTMAYTGYRKSRGRLLRAGIELYELRADAASASISNTPPVDSEWVGLHSKVIVVDRRRVFVGTFNIDPRSAFINSEMGIIIDAPELASAIADILVRDMSPDNAWRVQVGRDGFYFWESSEGVRYTAPSRGVGQEINAALLGILPLEDQM